MPATHCINSSVQCWSLCQIQEIPTTSYELQALQLLSIVQVHGSLEGLGSQPVWQQEDPSASAGGALPSFSAYPQQSVTAAGEYLMMMPQTLEGLLGSGDDAEDQMDSEWLDKVEVDQHEHVRAMSCTYHSMYCVGKTVTHACLQGARALQLHQIGITACLKTQHACLHILRWRCV